MSPPPLPPLLQAQASKLQQQQQQQQQPTRPTIVSLPPPDSPEIAKSKRHSTAAQAISALASELNSAGRHSRDDVDADGRQRFTPRTLIETANKAAKNKRTASKEPRTPANEQTANGTSEEAVQRPEQGRDSSGSSVYCAPVLGTDDGNRRYYDHQESNAAEETPPLPAASESTKQHSRDSSGGNSGQQRHYDARHYSPQSDANASSFSRFASGTPTPAFSPPLLHSSPAKPSPVHTQFPTRNRPMSSTAGSTAAGPSSDGDASSPSSASFIPQQQQQQHPQLQRQQHKHQHT
ncbi:hypothetical protein EV178_006344 [Coemansia sp. RSA 1646]|nr:hypothetical protein EV178_006344 [Coemansia sp. RSA 1646]